MSKLRFSSSSTSSRSCRDFIRCIAILSLLAAPVISNATMSTVGIYDEQTVQLNTVEKSAPFLSGSGAGNNSLLTLDVGTFGTRVSTAFSSGLGGVVSFDVAGDAVDSGTAFTALFNGGAKSLTMTVDDGSAWSIGVGPSANRTPISGTNGLAKNSASDSFIFNLSSIAGGQPNEHVVSFGTTLLSRNGSGGTFAWTGVATIQDTLGNSGTITNQATLNMNDGNALDDTFYGFQAPAGYYITRVALTGSQFTWADDVGFVTGVVVPEPSTVALLIAGLTGFAFAARRKGLAK